MKSFILKAKGRRGLTIIALALVIATTCFAPTAMAGAAIGNSPDPQSINPNFGYLGTTVNPAITGVNLQAVGAVVLKKTGQSDITGGTVSATDTTVNFSINIPPGAALGAWDVWVYEIGAGGPGAGDVHADTNVDLYSGVITGGFTILSGDSPEITAISPSRGAVGTLLQITGKNFGATRGSSYVSFGGTQAAGYGSWNATAITCTVPDLVTGPYDVTVTTSKGTSNSKTFEVTFPVWYLAEGSTAWGYWAYITIENPNAEAVTARVTYMTESGAIDRPDIQLPANSQATINPESDIGKVDFSTRVECVEGRTICVDRTMTWTGTNAASPEAHCSVGVPSPETTWYLAEGSSEWGFECWLLIQNPNDQEATCQVTYMIEGSQAQIFEKKVPANSRKTYNMEADIGKKDSSIKVDSNIPVIPERAMYRNNRREGHDSIGTVAPAKQYYLAEGTTAWGFTTYVLIQNPNNDAANVNLTYMTNEGAVQHPGNPINMPANSRKTVRVNDVLPGRDFSTLIAGDREIIAERAMYWDNGTGEACHDSIGIADAHTSFYLPDGQTNDGHETWTLVQNPNDTAVDVEISYLTPTGAGGVTFKDTIPKNSRKTYSLAEKVADGRASILVTCTTAGKQIIAERAMYWNSKGVGTSTIGGYSD